VIYGIILENSVILSKKEAFMNHEIVLKLIQNALFLLTLSLLYSFSSDIPEKFEKFKPYICGLSIGLIGIAIMSAPFVIDDGILVDARSILLSAAGIYFGLIPTAIGAGILCLYRIFLHGMGLLAGILIIISSSIIGLVFNRYYRKANGSFHFYVYYIMGVVVHLVMIATFFVMPYEFAVAVHKSAALPILIIFPTATFLLGYLLHHQARQIEAMQKLVEAEDMFRRLVEGAPEAIYIHIDDCFVFVNSYAVSLFGAKNPEDLIGTSVFDRYHPAYHDIIKKRIEDTVINKKPSPLMEQKFIRLDGSVVDVEVCAVPIDYQKKPGDMVFAKDITEKKAIEAHIIQQQKLEAIGTLAGGVAHEINNPLNGIMNYAQLIMEDMDPKDPNVNYLKEIIFETERISTIVKNLLQFSRQEKQSHSYASIYDIINQTLSLINTIIKKDQIILDLSLPHDLPPIKCRSQQIQQVLMNLITNARDALNEKYPGYHENKKIEVSCALFHENNRRWLRLIVADRGIGMSPEIQQKAFEPFYSTKPKESGTGLGLAISFGIIQDHHGRIFIDSKEGEYTKFIIELPVDNGWSLKGEEADDESSDSR